MFVMAHSALISTALAFGAFSEKSLGAGSHVAAEAMNNTEAASVPAQARMYMGLLHG
jgi:hypothetical protein